MERYFFEIPVFRCSLEKWNLERTKEVSKLANVVKQTEVASTKDLENAEFWLAGNFTSYKYSELVGMIRLYTMPGQVRAEVFYVINKKLVRNQKNKKWGYMGKLFEFMVFPDMSNEEIYEWTIKKLKRYCNESYLKNRYVDFSCFEVSGPFIDYSKLTGVD